MTISRDEFVTLLHDYADVDPPHPLAMREGVDRRVRRVKRRYTAYATAWAVAVLLIAVGVVRAVSGPQVVNPSTLALPAPTFTRNGVTYTRVDVAYLDTSRHKSVTVTIPQQDTPIAVYAACKLARPNSRNESAIALLTSASYDMAGGHFDCSIPSTYAAQVDRSALPYNGTRLTFAVMGTWADAPADAPAAWAFAVYTVALPANPPSPLPAAPSVNRAGFTYTLVHTYSGYWPKQRTVHVTIPAGKPSIISLQCPAPLTNTRIWLATTEDSEFINGNLVPCADPSNVTSDTTAELGEERPPAAYSPAPVKFTLIFDPTDQAQAGQWTIAIYQR